VTTTAVAFLGAIAVATVVMAVIQVGAIIYMARLAKRLEAIAGKLEREAQPTIARLTAMSGEAARAASLAAAQVARFERMSAELSIRLGEAAVSAQRALQRPARETTALLAALRAVALSLREARRRARRGRTFDDEDALFIG
jgi:hypothetical protein